MKKTALLFLAGGLIGGFAIGHASKSTPPPPAPEPEQPAEAKPIRPTQSTEQELLLQAIHELDLTTAELDDALQYIDKLERNTQRYNWLMDYWKEKGFGQSYQMGFLSHKQFKPSDDLVEFFGWDEEQVEEMTRIGQVTATSIKSWESENSVCIEDSEDKLVYEIAAIPEETIGQYLQSMEAILDPDDMELLSSKLEKQFEGVLQDRILTMTIGPAPAYMLFNSNDDPDQEYMTIQTKSKDDRPPFTGGFSSSVMPYKPGTIFPHSWNHVFKMEGTPVTISDSPILD